METCTACGVEMVAGFGFCGACGAPLLGNSQLSSGEVAFVAGSGSFAAEVADWAGAAALKVAGLVEMRDASRIGSTRYGFPVVGLKPDAGGGQVVLGLGGDRRASWDRLAAGGWNALALVHPSSSLASDVNVGAGATIGPRAVVGYGTEIAAQAIISRGALVGHHVRVGAYSTLNPGVNIGGNTTIGDDAFVGMGATVLNGVTVGDRAVIGAGALVLRDVEPGMRVQGVPAGPFEERSP